MSKFVLCFGPEVRQIVDSENMEPDEMAALKRLNGVGRLRFERLTLDRLPDLPRSHLGLVAEEIVSQPRGRYSPRVTADAERLCGRKAVRR